MVMVVMVMTDGNDIVSMMVTMTLTMTMLVMLTGCWTRVAATPTQGLQIVFRHFSWTRKLQTANNLMIFPVNGQLSSQHNYTLLYITQLWSFWLTTDDSEVNWKFQETEFGFKFSLNLVTWLIKKKILVVLAWCVSYARKRKPCGGRPDRLGWYLEWEVVFALLKLDNFSFGKVNKFDVYTGDVE